jgi:predicted acyltransferase
MRLHWLDAFRGLTIAGMILVNNPGSWGTIYAPLRHAAWDGCTPTDLIFPFFLFISGLSMAISGARRSGNQSRGARTLKLVRRSALLILTGLFLHAFPKFDGSTLRIPGVLQRIGLCTLGIGLLDLWLPRRGVFLAMLGGLVAYHLIFFGASFPAFDFPSFSQNQNPTRAIDLAVFGPSHIWVKGVFDPEGLVSTLTAAWTLYLGLLCGRRCFPGGGEAEATLGNWALGIGLALLGLGLARLHQPLNKPLWTPSDVAWTAGLAWTASLGLARLSGLLKLELWAYPLIAVGRNPLLLFVLSGLLARTLGLIRIESGSGASVTAKDWLYRNLFLSRFAPVDASLAYGLALVLLFVALGILLDRRRLYLKL